MAHASPTVSPRASRAIGLCGADLREARLVQVCQCVLQGWFSDNRRILALDGTSPSRRVRVIDVVDRTRGGPRDDIRRLTVGRADISPDGRWLAFSSQRQTCGLSRRAPATRLSEREWATDPEEGDAGLGAERACGWSPDGQACLYLASRTRRLSRPLRATDRSGARHGGWRAVHRAAPARPHAPVGINTPFGNAIVSNAFVFSQVETTGSIWLLNPEPASRRARTAND